MKKSKFFSAMLVSFLMGVAVMVAIDYNSNNIHSRSEAMYILELRNTIRTTQGSLMVEMEQYPSVVELEALARIAKHYEEVYVYFNDYTNGNN